MDAFGEAPRQAKLSVLVGQRFLLITWNDSFHQPDDSVVGNLNAHLNRFGVVYESQSRRSWVIDVAHGYDLEAVRTHLENYLHQFDYL